MRALLAGSGRERRRSWALKMGHSTKNCGATTIYDKTEVKMVGSGARLPGFHVRPASQTWAMYLISSSLNLFICKVGVLMELWGGIQKQLAQRMLSLFTMFALGLCTVWNKTNPASAFPSKNLAFGEEADLMRFIVVSAIKEYRAQPWLVWLTGWSTSLRTKRFLVRFPVRAHAWVAGWVPSWGRVRGN